jgi:hypothetical protein
MEAWERMEGESEEAHAAFQVYRDLPPGRRSVVEVARQCAKNRSLIGRWSSRHDWLQRVAAYDAWIDQQRVSTQLEALTEMWRRHASIALVGQQRAMAWLQQVDPAQLRDEVGLRLLVETTKLERIARGAQVDEEVPRWEPAGPLRTLAELFSPAGPGETRVTELELARVVVERAGHGREYRDSTEDLDLELAEMVEADGHDADGVPLVTEPPPEAEPEVDPLDIDLDPADEVAAAWQWLRSNPRRPPAGEGLVRWLAARKLVGLDPTLDTPPPRRHRRNGRR